MSEYLSIGEKQHGKFVNYEEKITREHHPLKYGFQYANATFVKVRVRRHASLDQKLSETVTKNC
jgi:hypothetical protein